MDGSLSSTRSPNLFKLLANDLRWKLLLLLARSDYGGQELVRLVKEPQNLVSYHLGLLSDQKVVTERRSTADGRGMYYSLDLETLRTLYFASADSLHPGLNATQQKQDELQFSDEKMRVLFLCTENSARSQMAEGILRHLSNGQVEVYSAGSHPSSLHPSAVQACASMNIDISQQRSKHMDEFRGQSFDYIVTVCDRVRESCPTFPGDPERIHWSFLDPLAIEGSEEARIRACEQVALQLMTRIRFLLILIEREKRKSGN